MGVEEELGTKLLHLPGISEAINSHRSDSTYIVHGHQTSKVGDYEIIGQSQESVTSSTENDDDLKSNSTSQDQVDTDDSFDVSLSRVDLERGDDTEACPSESHFKIYHDNYSENESSGSRPYYEPTYDSSGIYEINHAFMGSSLEPILENQVLSTINEENYDNCRPTHNDFNNQQEVVYLEENPSSYPDNMDTINSSLGYGSPALETIQECQIQTGFEDCGDTPAQYNFLQNQDSDQQDQQEGTEDNSRLPNISSLNTADFIPNENLPSDTSDLRQENPLEIYTAPDEESSFPTRTHSTNVLSHAIDLSNSLDVGETKTFKEMHSFPAIDHSGTFVLASNRDYIYRKLKQQKAAAPFPSSTHESNKLQQELTIMEDSLNNSRLNCEVPLQAIKDSVQPARDSDHHPHPDIDKGWAWVVVGAVFAAFAILSGLLFTCSLYYVAMLQEFGESRSYTAWVGSLVNAFFMLGSIVSSAFIQRFGCRSAMVLGSLVMTSGYIMSAFASSLQMIFLTYGVIVASGMNLVFSSTILVLAQYFNSRHCLATTLAMVGTGVGIFIMSQLLEQIIEGYGWRISYIFCAAVSIHLCICGSLLFPLPPSALESKATENCDAAGVEENERPLEENAVSLRMRGHSQQHSDTDSSDTDEDEGDNAREHSNEWRKKHKRLRKRRSSKSQHLYYQKDLLNRSFSSLMISAQAGYLSHSLASLDPRTSSALLSYHHSTHNAEHGDVLSTGRSSRHVGSSSRHHHHNNSSSNNKRQDRQHKLGDDLSMYRNDESYVFRASSILPSFLRSSQQSFSSKLSSAQISITGFKSGQPSKLSLKDSRLDLFFHGIKSNPHSFSLRHSSTDQREETEQLCGKLDDLLEEDRSSSEEALKEKLTKSSQHNQDNTFGNPIDGQTKSLHKPAEYNTPTYNNSGIPIDGHTKNSDDNKFTNPVDKQSTDSNVRKSGDDHRVEVTIEEVHTTLLDYDKKAIISPRDIHKEHDTLRLKHAEGTSDDVVEWMHGATGKDTEACDSRPDEKKASFLINGGESEDSDDDAQSSVTDVEYHESMGGRARCERLQYKLVCAVRWITTIRITVDPVLKDPGMWCFAFSYFFCILGTMTMYVTFKDFTEYIGLEDYCSMALSAAGLGDLIGRFGGGMLAANKIGNSTIFYAITMSLSAVVLGIYLFITDGLVFVAVATLFGILFGAQNIYIAVTPKDLFGREKLARIFGVSVFLAGIGSLIGPPLAGLAADSSDDGYLIVVIVEIACCLIASVLMFVCFAIKRVKNKATPNEKTSDKLLRNTDQHCVLKYRISKNNSCGLEVGDTSSKVKENDTAESQLIQNKKLIRQSLMMRDKCNGSIVSDCSSISQCHVRRMSDECCSNSSKYSIINIQQGLSPVSQHHKQSAPSIRYTMTHGSLHSLPMRTRCGSYTKPPNTQVKNLVLKRTSTCDSILDKSKTTPNYTPTNSRRNTLCATTRPMTVANKKKSMSLYEEVLGKNAIRNHHQLYTQSDENLSNV